MSLSSPSGHTLKFISTLGYNRRVVNTAKKGEYIQAIPVKSGWDVTTDRYITAPALAGGLGILMTDGDKAYFRSHFVESDATRKLGTILEKGLQSLDTHKPIRALVIGGSDHSQNAQAALTTATDFFQRHHIPATVLAPQKQTASSYPKGTNLIIKPKQRKVLVDAQDEVVSHNTSLTPLISSQPQLQAFFRDVHVADGDTVTFVAKDRLISRKQATQAGDDRDSRAAN